MLPNGIFARPFAACERLVDHGDERRAQIVAIGEVATSAQRNSHRREVVGRHEMKTRLRHRGRIECAAAFDDVPGCAAVAAERHRPHQRRRLHAGHRAHALDGALEEPGDLLGLRIPGLRQPELQREHVRRIEPERHVLHGQQALNEERRQRDERHRHGDFRDHQHVARAMSGARRTAGPGLQHATDIGPRRADGRHDTAQHRHGHRRSGGEQQDRRIERHVRRDWHRRRLKP